MHMITNDLKNGRSCFKISWNVICLPHSLPDESILRTFKGVIMKKNNPCFCISQNPISTSGSEWKIVHIPNHKGIGENLEYSIIQTIQILWKRLIYKPSFLIFLNSNFWRSMCIFTPHFSCVQNFKIVLVLLSTNDILIFDFQSLVMML